MKNRNLFILISTPLLSLTLTLRAAPSVAEQDEARFKVVVEYVNHVLADASDHYNKERSPLLANGVNVYTKEQLKWFYASGKEAVLSDFIEQQNLMRVLASLTNLTGEAKYKEAAKAQYAYYFAHFQDAGGLLQWGGHRFVDLQTLTPVGFSGPADSPHELKNAYPYYELMYEVSPEATVRFITGFWNAHVYNWRTLEVSRHGDYGHEPGAHWDHPFDDPAPYFETKGLSFLDAGNDLIYSGAMLYKLTGDRGALLWSKRLAQQYVKARDPKTKLGAYQYTQPKKTQDTTDDSITLSWYGDRAKRQFGPDFPGHLVLEATMLLRRLAMTIYSDNALMQLQVGETLGKDGKDLIEWTREGMVAYVQHAQIPGKNLLRPMLTDGTDLTGFIVQRDGYYDRKGLKIEAYRATPELMIAYARGFMITQDPILWKMAHGIALDFDLGDVGEEPGKSVKLNLRTKCADPFALFSMLDLFRQTRADAYLQLSRAIGNNIVTQRYHHGYFTPFEDTIYANINTIEPYALLALDATIKGAPEKVPYFINGFGFFSGEYRFPNGKSRRINDDLLYRPRKSAPELPFDRQSNNVEG
ncbi:MAG TPA: hypothetical protein VKC60_08985 [Opitutaceae bacterium]|nr:hypothetical protein [Opitutaceae bacterium]